MTKEEFLARLPATIFHPNFGECSLNIVDNIPYRKSACYMNQGQYKSGYSVANNWDNLHKEMTLYLVREGHVK